MATIAKVVTIRGVVDTLCECEFRRQYHTEHDQPCAAQHKLRDVATSTAIFGTIPKIIRIAPEATPPADPAAVNACDADQPDAFMKRVWGKLC